MSLSALEGALVEFVGDVLVNTCARPVPSRLLRYHGAPGAPADCCTDDGTLSISWERGYPSATFPSPAGSSTDPCPSPLMVYVLNVKYQVCWPALQVGEGGITLVDDTWDSSAAMLADVADCVARALLRLTCSSPELDDPFQAAIYEEVARNQIRYVSVAPINPGGLCTGLIWSLYAAVSHGAPAS